MKTKSWAEFLCSHPENDIINKNKRTVAEISKSDKDPVEIFKKVSEIESLVVILKFWYPRRSKRFTLYS